MTEKKKKDIEELRRELLLKHGMNAPADATDLIEVGCPQCWGCQLVSREVWQNSYVGCKYCNAVF